VPVLVVAQSSSEIQEGLMNNPVHQKILTIHGPLKVKCVLNYLDGFKNIQFR